MSTTHTLTFEVPTTRDYLNGGYGELIAQCSCGLYEYVSSRTEGAYWHGLHTSNLGARSHRLLQLLVDYPMPDGWEPAALAPVSARQELGPRSYACGTCVGAGSIEVYGAHNGRFYQWGERATCPRCGGSGSVAQWAAA